MTKKTVIVIMYDGQDTEETRITMQQMEMLISRMEATGTILIISLDMPSMAN